MRQLIVYMQVTSEPFPMVPPEVLRLQNEDIRVADLDNRSGKEVVGTVLTALDQAEEVLMITDITSKDASCSALFPVFKKALKSPEKTKWIQLGDHDQLAVFHKQMAPVFPENSQALFELICTGIKS